MSDAFTPLEPRLKSLAYRLLGSWADAEDVVQEAHLAFLALSERPASDKAWLETVVTNKCLDVLKSARSRRETYVGPWLPEPMLSTELLAEKDPFSVSLAFLTLLERLSPLERAAFVLAEAFDYSAEEIGQTLQREAPAVRQLLHRAREHVHDRKPRFHPDDETRQQVMSAFFTAVTSGDVAAIEQVLVEQARLRSDGGGKVRAALNELTGASRIARFFVGIAAKNTVAFEYRVAHVNGAPSLLVLAGGVVQMVVQLETDGRRVTELSLVLNPDKLGALSKRLTA